jgi:hypothetical protein
VAAGGLALLAVGFLAGCSSTPSSSSGNSGGGGNPCATTSCGSNSTPTSTPTAVTPPVLLPAQVPPVVGDCSEQLEIGADGNASPVTCTNGDINVLAWNYFDGVDPTLLGLGPYATEQQVQDQLCTDMQTSTIPIEESVYALAQAYYGWQFGVDPTSILTNGAC